MKLNKSLPNAIYRNGKKLGYNRSFNTIVEARKFVKHLKNKHPYTKPLTQIRRNTGNRSALAKPTSGRYVFYAVYSTDY
jgi:hypothetical protein